jgi:Kef-type K+ transport system membrane component KefB
MGFSKNTLYIYLTLTILSVAMGAWILWEGSELKPNFGSEVSRETQELCCKSSKDRQNGHSEIDRESTSGSQSKDFDSASSEDTPDSWGFGQFIAILKKNLGSPLSKTLTQIVIIMIFARVSGVFFRKLGQPTVIGEIIAGILLGPSLFGLVLPDLHSYLFSSEQVEVLETLSQVGLILFMFVIGMEIDLGFIRKKAQSALLISHASIFFPFLLGMILAFQIYPEYAPPGVRFYQFSLFLGIAMSITAFPVLARILHEKGLTKTSLGSMAIACAAFDDLTAWILLAMIIALVQTTGFVGVVFTIFLTIVYGLIMFFLVQPFLKRLSEIYVSRENLTKTAMAIVFAFLFASALVTELIGIHALIGAFFAGVVMPSDQRLKNLISERIDYIALVFLLPLFFAYTGMRTDLGELANFSLITILFWILVLAIIGKFVGSSLAARSVGMDWKDSLSLGTLMNTRGLMELIVLNIGYQLGILTPALFSAFVVMTLVTTLLTGPTLSWIQNLRFGKKDPAPNLEAFKRILISFAQASMGVALIKLADFLFGANRDKTQISAIHITPTEFISPEEEKEYKRKSFGDIEKLMHDLDFNVEMVHRTTENITYEILNQAKKSNSRFLLIGAAKSLFTKNILGGRIKSILSYAPCNVGVLLDNGLDQIKKVLILKKANSSLGYEKLIHYLQKEHNRKVKINNVSMFSVLKHEDFSGYQLVLIELDLWKEREEFLEIEIQNLDSSFLIVQFK